MADKGWFKTYRELWDKAIWKTSTPEQKVILMTLMSMVNHKPSEWEWQGKKFVVQPGQMITSLDSITQKCGKGITVKNVRTALAKFKKYEFLANEPTKTGRLITIVNWGIYQGEEKKPAKQPANDGQRGGNEVAANKNDKNDKKKNYGDLERNFDLLWKLYPRKMGKSDALKHYKSAIKDGVTNKQIQDGIVRYLRDIQKDGTDRQHIAYGSTWFNQRRWEETDEITSEYGGANVESDPQARLAAIKQQLSDYGDDTETILINLQLEGYQVTRKEIEDERNRK